MTRDQLFAMSEVDARRLRGWARTHEIWDAEPWSEADRILMERLNAWIERQSRPVMVRGD